jgi:ketosteroid isomerase-like protein
VFYDVRYFAARQQTVKRRYTNIWMKKDGNWKLVARHANVICAQN